MELGFVTAICPAAEVLTSSPRNSHQCQLQGSRNRRTLNSQEQLCVCAPPPPTHPICLYAELHLSHYPSANHKHTEWTLTMCCPFISTWLLEQTFTRFWGQCWSWDLSPWCLLMYIFIKSLRFQKYLNLASTWTQKHHFNSYKGLNVDYFPHLNYIDFLPDFCLMLLP